MKLPPLVSYFQYRHMSFVKPREFVSGGGRGLTVRGRVLAKRHVKIKDQFFTEIHLVCEAGSKGLIYIESWRDQAVRLNRDAATDSVIDLTGLRILPMGEKAQYQVSELDVFAQVFQNVTIAPVAPENVPASLPAFLPHVDLDHVKDYMGKSQQVNVAAHFLDLETARTTTNGSRVAKAWLVSGTTRISISIWHECIPAAQKVTPGEVTFCTRLTLKAGPDNTVELNTSKASEFLAPPLLLGRQVMDGTPSLCTTSLTTISHVYTRTDYATEPAKLVTLASLAGTVVPGQARELSGLYVVHHVLVLGLAPLGSNEALYYEACETCKKKLDPGATCPDHPASGRNPWFLTNVTIADATTTATAKAIGKVVVDMIDAEASVAVPDSNDETPLLTHALDNARARPCNFKFVLARTQDGTKNLLEIVHATASIDLAGGTAASPQALVKTVPATVPGVVPTAVDQIQWISSDSMKVAGVCPTIVQVFAQICDTGNENYAIAQEGNVARIKRKAVCCLSGIDIFLLRTGRLVDMAGYLRLDKGDTLFVIARPVRAAGDEPAEFFVLGYSKMTDQGHVPKFNTYFQKYMEDCHKILLGEPVPMEKAWTPKRRKTSIEAHGSSDTPLSHTPLAATPLKHGSPP